MSRPKPGAESTMRRGFPDAVQKKMHSAEKNTDYIWGDFRRGSALCVFDPAYAVSDPVPVS